MGVKGKLIASMEVKCGGHLIHDLMHTNTHQAAIISPTINHLEPRFSAKVAAGAASRIVLAALGWNHVAPKDECRPSLSYKLILVPVHCPQQGK
ncbi:hypothetical protein KY285_000627 [Solanum tuberosum]|nr:hypothetical protein KY285_000627 [Solanum tuberosum]